MATRVRAALLLLFVNLAFAIAPMLAASAETIKQIPLTEKHIENFIALSKGLTADMTKPALEAQARKHGFDSFEHLDVVMGNIALVMAGLDPTTKKFKQPEVAIRDEMEAVRKDKNFSETERKAMIADLEQALKLAAPVRYPANVDLVRRHYDRLSESFSK